MVPLTLTMVGYLYWSNAKLIVQRTAEIMQRSTAVISRDVQSLISPVERLLQSTMEIVRNDRGSLQRVQGLSYFYRQINPLPQVYSIYVGFHNSGDFYQVIRIPPGLTSLGPSDVPLPPDSGYALRLLDDSSGSRADSFIIYGDWGDVKQVFRGPPDFDPRLRPWYDNAWSNDGTAISKAYVFASPAWSA